MAKIAHHLAVDHVSRHDLCWHRAATVKAAVKALDEGSVVLYNAGGKRWMAVKR